MSPKASIFRLEPDAQSALAVLGRLLGKPMNKLVNEAVKDYLLKVSAQEHQLAESLEMLQTFRQRESRVREAPAEYKAAHLDPPRPGPEILAASREFVRRASIVYPVQKAILYGSRARGTHRADSDVDIALILTGARGKLMPTSLAMADLAFDVLLETTVYIQPFPIWEDEWRQPDTHSNPRLLENIQREGISL